MRLCDQIKLFLSHLKHLEENQEKYLLSMLCTHKEAFRQNMAYIQGIDPPISIHVLLWKMMPNPLEKCCAGLTLQ